MSGIKFIAAALLCLTLSMPAGYANSLAIFRTTLGEMAFELFDDEKPITVRNFTLLEKFGVYDNNFFHVCAAGVIVQGGGFYAADPLSTNPAASVFGNPNLGTITNEFSVGTIYSNEYGTIAMAKVAGNPDSATSQWFINLRDNTAFNTNNGGFTVFGRIIAGTNVLDQLTVKSNLYGTINLGSPFTLLPVTYIGTNPPNYNELIYSGVEMLVVTITPDPAGTKILWNSPSTLACRVEAQDMTGGAWNTLHLTNGNGLVQSYVDTNNAAANRTYRIRVE